MKTITTLLAVLVIAAFAVACLVWMKKGGEPDDSASVGGGASVSIGEWREGDGKEPAPDDEDHDNENEVME